MQSVMLEKALYKVPHESGWFDAPIENIFDPTEESKETDDTPRGDDNVDDDGYARLA